MTVVRYIFINGYPGVGKLTIAKELQRLIPGSQVLDYNTMLDMIPSTMPVDSPEYNAKRSAVRGDFLDAAAQLDYTRRLTWIFTDVLYADEAGGKGAREYQTAAHARGVQFWPVVLECDEDMNEARLEMVEKFAEQREDVEGLRKIRGEKKLHSFGEGGDEELKMDVTRMMPDEAAWKIFEHMREGFVWGTAAASSS
ncbi:hypothetical protein B0T11DRAFT_271857 [Plectosphaerella cucumerina]|uniref:P-loop containing nucleoside triphosphate hydrolase protein n=1 Tax=Plectosphaerella cucumerina TaxID=40658 RepID=A0A8K0TUC3_9PEZI|nr:hypothetical protein B0T11DRAFT_271857 [Plectosphaerella cucumerina]